MRTTLNIDDALYRDLKAQAARSGTSVTALVEDAVRVALARTQQVSGPGAARDLRLTTVAGRGLRPGVDLSDGAALRDFMDESDGTDEAAGGDEAS